MDKNFLITQFLAFSELDFVYMMYLWVERTGTNPKLRKKSCRKQSGVHSLSGVRVGFCGWSDVSSS